MDPITPIRPEAFVEKSVDSAGTATATSDSRTIQHRVFRGFPQPGQLRRYPAILMWEDGDPHKLGSPFAFSAAGGGAGLVAPSSVEGANDFNPASDTVVTNPAKTMGIAGGVGPERAMWGLAGDVAPEPVMRGLASDVAPEPVMRALGEVSGPKDSVSLYDILVSINRCRSSDQLCIKAGSRVTDRSCSCVGGS